MRNALFSPLFSILVLTGLSVWLLADDDTREQRGADTIPLTLRLYSVKPTFAAGEAIDLLLILHNHSDRRIVVFDQYANFEFNLTVKPVNGENTKPTAHRVGLLAAGNNMTSAMAGAGARLTA